MAFFKGSYYGTLNPFEENGEGPVFRGPRSRPIARPEAVLEHSVTVSDRLDALGQHYYANSRDWRRLADCNPEAIFAEDLIVTPLSFPQPEEAEETDPPVFSGEETNDRIGHVILVPRRREGR